MSKSSISYFLFLFLISTTAFQFSAWGIKGEIYNILRLVIIVLIFILLFFNVEKSIKYYRHIPLLRTHIWCLLLFSCVIFALYIIGFEIDFSPARDLALALIILIIGLNMELSVKQFKQVVNIYIILFAFAALSIVFTFFSGFVIQDQYLPVPKNQLAPAFGVAFMLSIYFAFKHKGISKWIYIILSLLLLASLLGIRGRAVIVAIFLTMLIYIFYYVPTHKYRLIIIFVILLLMPFIGQYFYDALFLNYDISDIDSISTGRSERNIAGFDFLLNHPLFGILESSFKGKTIHNYILISLVSYGVLLGSIILIIYVKYILSIIKGIRQNKYRYFEVGPLVMLILFIVSIFEYTYPYAPGSTIIFPFFLMGQYFRISSNCLLSYYYRDYTKK